MTRVATKRLIDASAKLGEDDRALVSLIVHHGLDDGALARLVNVSPEEVAARRERLAARLSAELGLSPATVTSALEELASAAREHHSANHHQASAENHVSPGTAAAHTPAEAPAETLADPSGRVEPTRHRRPATLTLLILAIAIAVVLVIALSSGGKSGGKPGGTAHPATAVLRARGPLAGLPGGSAGATGTLALEGPVAHPRLILTVAGLPSAGSGYYELWLYNSIIDSLALANLGASGRSVAVPLPSGYRHYSWLDVSLQPTGSVNHSGESVLRAAVPR